MKKPFLFVPGAWMGAWVWNDVTKILKKQNHTVYSITLRGLHSEHDNKDAGLQDHVDDVKHFVQTHALTDIILVGHSYSGFVIAQVADQIPDKISTLIFIEAFLPTNGKTLFQVAELDPKEENQAIEANAGKWQPPTREDLAQQPHLTPELADYLANKLIDHPAKTVTDKAIIKSEEFDVPSIFIGRHLNLTDAQKALYGNVEFHALDGGHWTMLSTPDKLAELLYTIATTD